jgi:hypothetical protein
MDPVEVLVRLIEGAVENSARRRQQEQQRTPILYRPNPQQAPPQAPPQLQRGLPPQMDPRVAFQRAQRATSGRPLPAQGRARHQAVASNVRTSAPPPVPAPAAPAKIAPPTSPASPVPSTPTRVDARALHRWLTPATLRRQFMLTEVLQPPVALRPNHLE